MGHLLAMLDRGDPEGILRWKEKVEMGSVGKGEVTQGLYRKREA